MASERLIERLTELGFSKYEARAYVGLLGLETATGYALANVTGIPQPKVYETLRRLVDRGAAVRVADRPARFSALPADRLLDQLEEEFGQRLAAAQVELEQLQAPGATEWHESVIRLDGYDVIRPRAQELIAAAERKLYVSGWAEQLEDLREPLREADQRGVEIITLHFGTLSFSLEHGQAYRHASTDGALYRSHRSRQLAIVPDSECALWALAPDRTDWEAILTRDQRLIRAVKAYLRHDIYVQKIYERLGDEMHEIFGPGLEYLMDVSKDDALNDRPRPAAGRAPASTEATTKKPTPAKERRRAVS